MHSPLFFVGAEIPTRDDLWSEGASSAANSLYRWATTAKADRVSLYEMWHGQTLPFTMVLVLKPCFYRLKRKNQPCVGNGFCLGPAHRHPRDAVCVMGHSQRILPNRHVTWWAPTKPMLNGEEATDAEPGRIKQQEVDQTSHRGDDGVSRSSSDICSDGHAETLTSSSNYISDDDDDGGSRDNPSIPNMDAPNTSWTQSGEGNASPSCDASPPSLDGPQFPTQDQDSMGETKVDPQHFNAAQTRALQQHAPHTRDPPGTALTEMRPRRTRGQTSRVLDNLSQQARSIISIPTAHCMAEDVSRGWS